MAFTRRVNSCTVLATAFAQWSCGHWWIKSLPRTQSCWGRAAESGDWSGLGHLAESTPGDLEDTQIRFNFCGALLQYLVKNSRITGPDRLSTKQS